MTKRSIIFVIAVTISFMITNYFTAKRIESARPPTEQVSTAGNSAAIEAAPSTTIPQKESYYVLENEYQQLVFSSLGGSLVEINLPFKTNFNTKSSILPISLDKKIVTASPHNSQFPLHEAETVQADGTKIIKNSTTGGYYPLLRRDLIDQNGKTYHKMDPSQYACLLYTSPSPRD
mgnify:FL=1